MADLMLGRRLQTWAVIALIVKVRAAADHIDAQLRQERLDLTLKLALAVIAARAVVADVIGILKFFCRDDMVANADLLHQAASVGNFRARHAGAVSSYGGSTIAESEPSRL